MFETIVWATDGSRRCDHALPQLRELSGRYGSSVRIVHVAPSAGIARLSAPSYQEPAINKLKAQTRSLRRHGTNASLHVVRGSIGDPARQIVGLARAVDADLLIVTGRGRSPLRGVAMGSVTQRLVGAAPCPVLVLTAPDSATARTGPDRHSADRAQVTGEEGRAPGAHAVR
jgi:nucleotide-binding universal stress UspA family protein